MFDINTLYRDAVDHKFYFTDESGEQSELKEDYPIEYWDSPEAFKEAHITGYEPMTAKELETEELQDEKLRDKTYFLEEKFDGTRALVYFLGDHCRVFSRRVSKKTGFYVENTDSLPQIKTICRPELNGTILDGEMFINGLPFKEVSSTLNCLWDKAVDRQIEKGFISLHAFDILFYHGIDLRKMTLERRKVYLHLAVEEANSPYIEEVRYYDCGKDLPITAQEYIDNYCSRHFDIDVETYPNLYKCWESNKNLTPRAYYEIIVASGGEGLIVKPKNGKYLHKRGWEYSKIKKFLTRELIVIGFEEPTKEYTGKDVRRWGFWERNSDHAKLQGNFYGDKNYTPVTKFYYYNQVGVMKLGVLISPEEYESIKPNKRGAIYQSDDVFNPSMYLMEVCDCSGFDDETREYFTRNKDSVVGSVVEVKANELFRDSGKMRHPRYLRMRYDKEPERCIWLDHIGTSEVTK